MNDGRSAMFKPRPRIEALSDLVFGLALSIGALTLINQQFTSFEQLMIALAQYAFSFLILVSVWRSYSTTTSILPAETETLIRLNITLLFLVSIEPFLFNQLFAENNFMFSEVSTAYAIDLGAMFIILAFFNNILAGEEKPLVPKELLKKYRFHRNYDLLIAAIFLVSTVPFFASVYVFNVTEAGFRLTIPLRVIVWILALIMGWVRRIWQRAAGRAQKDHS